MTFFKGSAPTAPKAPHFSIIPLYCLIFYKSIYCISLFYYFIILLVTLVTLVYIE